ncbi:restriction endonuclease subunit S [Ideonella sp. DXS22W]|uniref:Restriction endonuclease subunit S n=1 Tax=Pseudaquabacterium inlustre TaxID=2984192 RepID=A0ABU9CP75_9BURK
MDRLRRLIVELAVSGRLVPQRSDDEPAADLAARLAANKTRAVTDGGRRAKALALPDAPNWPFAIPNSWTWQALDDLLWITGGVTLGRKLTGRTLVALPYLRVANVQRGQLMLDDLKEIEVPADEADKYLLEPGDLLITEGGDWDKVGRTAIWQGELEQCLHQNHVFRARACSDEFLPRWAELYLNSPAARSYFAGSSKQTTNLASINMTQLRSCAFPLPPLAEQRRIVAKVDELMALCDHLQSRMAAARAKHAQLAEALVVSTVQDRQDHHRADTTRERVRTGKEKVFSLDEVERKLGLAD